MAPLRTTLGPVKSLLIASLLTCLSAHAALAPREAAKLSASETSARLRSGPGRVLISLGLHEIRNTEPQSLIQMDLQYPVLSTFSIALQAMAPTKRKDLSYYVGGALHWYRRPNAGLWLQAGAGQFNFRKTSGIAGYTGMRAMVGWRWRPVDHTGSFGFAVGPEMNKVAGKSVWGAALRFDVGADFRPESFFF